MNIIRYFLYGALAIVCLLLWNTWQAEHPAKKIEQVTSIQQNVVPPKQAALTPQKKPNDFVSQTIQKTPEKRIVNVKTDVLNVDIDTLGGGVVRVTLPKYPKILHSKKSFLLLNDNPETIYTAQSGVVRTDEINKPRRPILYQASKKQFVLENGQKNLIVTLRAKTKDGLAVTKTFTFKPNRYDVVVDYQVSNQSNKAWAGNYYMQFTRSGVPPEKKGRFVVSSFFGVALSSPEKSYEKHKFSKLSEAPINKNIKDGWLAMVQHYFLGAWVPNHDTDYHYYSQAGGDNIFKAGMIGPTINLQPNQSHAFQSNFYAGPKITKRLDKLSPHLWLTIDYGWLWFISLILFYVMDFVYKIIGNWGWSIIAVTILIKLAFYHLSSKSYKSMAGVSRLQPKIAALKERYGDDKQGMTKAMMELYRKEKINPLGGCLPILVQIPVFIALYWVLLESVQLRQAPFIFWIHDLSIKDPFYILPILMGLSMFVQQKLNPPPPDPTQAKVMMLLPVFMTVVFINFPAGLVLYWIVNNVLSIAQQWYIKEKYGKIKRK